jgi:hypothetical protein
LFLIGSLLSKLVNHPSKAFLGFLAVLLTALDFLFLKSFKPVLKALPEFFVDWASQNTFDGFLLGLVLFFYVAVIFASLLVLKQIAKKMREKFKSK